MTGMKLERKGVAAVLVVAAVLALSGDRRVQAVSPTADSLVTAALAAARTGNRVILIEFGASWCTWCRSFDAFVHAPQVRQIIAGNFVVVNLTVHERDDKKALENPGGEAKMNGWGGAKSGLPFYVFLDTMGHRIADSNAMPNGGNIGFPGTPQEVQVFVDLISRTAPKLSRTDRAAIVEYLNSTLKR
jgi:thioredoxin-related protein